MITCSWNCCASSEYRYICAASFFARERAPTERNESFVGARLRANKAIQANPKHNTLPDTPTRTNPTQWLRESVSY